MVAVMASGQVTQSPVARFYSAPFSPDGESGSKRGDRKPGWEQYPTKTASSSPSIYASLPRLCSLPKQRHLLGMTHMNRCRTNQSTDAWEHVTKCENYSCSVNMVLFILCGHWHLSFLSPFDSVLFMISFLNQEFHVRRVADKGYRKLRL